MGDGGKCFNWNCKLVPEKFDWKVFKLWSRDEEWEVKRNVFNKTVMKFVKPGYVIGRFSRRLHIVMKNEPSFKAVQHIINNFI